MLSTGGVYCRTRKVDLTISSASLLSFSKLDPKTADEFAIRSAKSSVAEVTKEHEVITRSKGACPRKVFTKELPSALGWACRSIATTKGH